MPPKTRHNWHAVNWAHNNQEIAERLGVSVWTVIEWRMRLGVGPGRRKQRSDAGVKHPGTRPAAREVQPKATAAAKLSPIAGRGVTHRRAIDWTLRSPDGITYRVHNLYEFVRQHPELFGVRDVAWKRQGGARGTGGEWCNATAGLLNIKAGRARAWKGWTLIDDEEHT